MVPGPSDHSGLGRWGRVTPFFSVGSDKRLFALRGVNKKLCIRKIIKQFLGHFIVDESVAITAVAAFRHSRGHETPSVPTYGEHLRGFVYLPRTYLYVFPLGPRAHRSSPTPTGGNYVHCNMHNFHPDGARNEGEGEAWSKRCSSRQISSIEQQDLASNETLVCLMLAQTVT